MNVVRHYIFNLGRILIKMVICNLWKTKNIYNEIIRKTWRMLLQVFCCFKLFFENICPKNEHFGIVF